jgi:hypothetical protein
MIIYNNILYQILMMQKTSLNIASIFDTVLLDVNMRNNIVNILEELYKDDIINTELLLNIVKGFILIFNSNPSHSIIYCEILNDIPLEQKKKIFNCYKKIKLSTQTKLSEFIIQKTIYYINNFVINNYNKLKNDIILMSLYNYYDIISKCNRFPPIMKVHLYHIALKHNINTQDLRQCITIMNKFIN